jgi:hypothetical protein
MNGSHESTGRGRCPAFRFSAARRCLLLTPTAAPSPVVPWTVGDGSDIAGSDAPTVTKSGA